MKKKITSLILLTVFMSNAVSLVFSQETSVAEDTLPTVTLDATVSSVILKDQVVDKTTELRNLYRSQIEVYRNSQQQFEIAKEQYFRLQTLSALEEAVRATREALLNRSRVLLTYVQLLEVTLRDIPGVNLSQKTEALTRLEKLESDLQNHQDAILGSESREEVALRANEFAAMADELESTTYLSQSLISTGKVQTVYDQALIIHNDITTFHANSTASTLVQAGRERAHAETNRNFSDLQLKLREITDSITKQSEDLDDYSKVSHDRIVESLEGPYLSLTQLVGYLRELLKM